MTIKSCDPEWNRLLIQVDVFGKSQDSLTEKYSREKSIVGSTLKDAYGERGLGDMKALAEEIDGAVYRSRVISRLLNSQSVEVFKNE